MHCPDCHAHLSRRRRLKQDGRCNMCIGKLMSKDARRKAKAEKRKTAELAVLADAFV